MQTANAHLSQPVPASNRPAKFSLLSLRGRRSVPWFGGILDAENVLVGCLDAELHVVRRSRVLPTAGPLGSLHFDRLLAQSRLLRPYRVDADGSAEADALLVMVNDLHDCIVLLGTPGWSRLGRVVLVHVAELSARDASVYRPVLSMLQRNVDHLFLGTDFVPASVLRRGRIQTVELIPPVLDVLAFGGERAHSEREIDVFNPGRRNPYQHAALAKHVDEIRGRYVFDKTFLGSVDDLTAHRRWFTDTASASRIFVTNPMRFDKPGRRGPTPTAGLRFYEAAAAGCCLVGSFTGRPSEGIPELAGVGCVELPMDDRPLRKELVDLLGNPQLTEARGRAARCVALRHHDIAHRWATMAEVAGLPAAPGVDERRRRLWQHADECVV